MFFFLIPCFVNSSLEVTNNPHKTAHNILVDTRNQGDRKKISEIKGFYKTDITKKLSSSRFKEYFSLFQTTYDQVLEVRNLKPFSIYIFYVALKNYYSGLEEIIPVTGPPTRFQTAAGGKTSLIQ
jgi:hypothetical protein